MFLITFEFLVFLAASLLLYYLLPGKLQWVALLAASAVFYLLAGTPGTVVYLLASILSVWAAGLGMERFRGTKAGKRILVVAVVLNMGLLAALKYTNFFLLNFQRAGAHFGWGEDIQPVTWAASLGISYYTLMAVSYLLDVYWETSPAQKNLGKVALYVSFFPQMSSGPISRYHELGDQLYAPHRFDYLRLCQGLQRMIVGFLEKLVLAENLSTFVTPIFDSNANYNGAFIWIGMALYLVQIYADFAGCMNIVLGAAQCFGIRMPENFDRPFHSRSIQEFWKHWHITLGAWAQDYIMYPLLRSRLWTKMQRKLKKSVGKKAAKQIPAWLAMLALWFYMGLWHGGAWRYVTEGVWFWLVIVSGQILEPCFKRWKQRLHIHPDSPLWQGFQSLRTSVIFGIGVLFFRSPSVSRALGYLKSAFSPKCLAPGNFLAQLSVWYSGLGRTVVLRTAVCVGIGAAAALVMVLFRARGKSFYEWLGQRNLVVRWGILYILMFAVLLFGVYGPGYNAADFIYGGF